MTTNSAIDFDSFMKSGGIYESTIENFNDCDIFFMGRESVHVMFFNQLMDDDASCILILSLIILTFEPVATSMTIDLRSAISNSDMVIQSPYTNESFSLEALLPLINDK
jgi:hypothetical protein